MTTAGIRFILFTIFIVTTFTFIEFVFFRLHLQGFGNLAGGATTSHTPSPPPQKPSHDLQEYLVKYRDQG